MKKVIVITGINDLGLAIARRIGNNYKLLLADCDRGRLAAAAHDLNVAGYDVVTAALDVVSLESVQSLAQTAAGLGELQAIIHTASLAPTTSSPERIISVNLVGTAHIIAAFEPYLSAGTVGIMVASLAGRHAAGVDPSLQKQLTKVKADELVAFIRTLDIRASESAYSVSRYGNLAQVQSAAVAWGCRGARLVSVTPSFIAVAIGRHERGKRTALDDVMAQSQRIVTPEDVAAVVDFLHSPAAVCITGTDVLVDHGVYAFAKGISIN